MAMTTGMDKPCPVCGTLSDGPSLGSICSLCGWERDSDEESNDPNPIGPNGTTVRLYKALWEQCEDKRVVQACVDKVNEMMTDDAVRYLADTLFPLPPSSAR